jgi:glucose dehydrogenase
MKAFLLVSFSALGLFGQLLNPATLLKQPTDAWPTYNGDYSGRRFSPLTQINSSNVHTLSLAWATRYSSARQGGNSGPEVPIKATPLLVNGILYFTTPNNVFAADARTGRELWHYQYPPNTGSTIGNRGVGMYGNWLFFESPDSNLISLDAHTGKERWKVRIADPKLDYTSTVAPVIVGNHVLVGIGGDHLDNPGFLESRDPETGAVQWRWWTTPRKGEPGIDTWPDEYSSAHGTGQTWIPGTYDA